MHYIFDNVSLGLVLLYPLAAIQSTLFPFSIPFTFIMMQYASLCERRLDDLGA